jgi:hypothetical protein
MSLHVGSGQVFEVCCCPVLYPCLARVVTIILLLWSMTYKQVVFSTLIKCVREEWLIILSLYGIKVQ